MVLGYAASENVRAPRLDGIARRAAPCGWLDHKTPRLHGCRTAQKLDESARSAVSSVEKLSRIMERTEEGMSSREEILLRIGAALHRDKNTPVPPPPPVLLRECSKSSG